MAATQHRRPQNCRVMLAAQKNQENVSKIERRRQQKDQKTRQVSKSCQRFFLFRRALIRKRAPVGLVVPGPAFTHLMSGELLLLPVLHLVAGSAAEVGKLSNKVSLFFLLRQSELEYLFIRYLTFGCGSLRSAKLQQHIHTVSRNYLIRQQIQGRIF